MTGHRLPLSVTSPRVDPHGPGIRVSASIDGRELWFECAEFHDEDRMGDAFLAVALLPAMAQGRDLDLTDLPPISPRLLDTIPQVQAAWLQWNPRLSSIDLWAPRGTSAPGRPGTATAFSGGVNSSHAALAGSPGHPVVRLLGMGSRLAESEHAAMSHRLTRLASTLNAPLLTVTTNWESWRQPLGMSYSLMHGGALMAVGHLLGPEQWVIPASSTMGAMIPHGTHPVMDPLWSSDSTHVSHWGGHLTFTEKLARLIEVPEILDTLSVCNEPGVGNCGHCRLCARTRLCLELLGAELSVAAGAASSPPLTSYLPHLSDERERPQLTAVLALAQERGRTDVSIRLERALARFERRRLLRSAADAFRGRLPGEVRRSGELLPWGHGPVPSFA